MKFTQVQKTPSNECIIHGGNCMDRVLEDMITKKRKEPRSGPTWNQLEDVLNKSADLNEAILTVLPAMERELVKDHFKHANLFLKKLERGKLDPPVQIRAAWNRFIESVKELKYGSRRLLEGPIKAELNKRSVAHLGHHLAK